MWAALGDRNGTQASSTERASQRGLSVPWLLEACSALIAWSVFSRWPEWLWLASVLSFSCATRIRDMKRNFSQLVFFLEVKDLPFFTEKIGSCSTLLKSTMPFSGDFSFFVLFNSAVMQNTLPATGGALWRILTSKKKFEVNLNFWLIIPYWEEGPSPYFRRNPALLAMKVEDKCMSPRGTRMLLK